MYEILISGSDRSFNQDLSNYLQSQYTVLVAENHSRTMELICREEPDALCIDLRRDPTEDVMLIRNVRMSGRNIPIIVIANEIGKRLCSYLHRLRVDKVCLKPVQYAYIAQQLKSGIITSQNVDDPLRLEDELDLLLCELGFRIGPDRYNMIRTAILMKYKQSSGTLMKNIYLDIAETFGVRSANAEKAIRDGIRFAWEKGDSNLWRMYFLSDGARNIRCPSNEDFVKTIAVALRKEGRRRKADCADKAVM